MKKLAILLAAIYLVGTPAEAAQGKEKRYPKLAPFSAIRWKESIPEVKVKDSWYELLAIDGIEAREVVKFCKEAEGKRWQKRFEEDLVEMMARRGHEPGERVTLRVRDLKTGKTETFSDVPNTHANRQAIWQARNQGK